MDKTIIVESPAWKYRLSYLRDGKHYVETFGTLSDLGATRLACNVYGFEILSVMRGCTSLTEELSVADRWFALPIEEIIL